MAKLSRPLTWQEKGATKILDCGPEEMIAFQDSRTRALAAKNQQLTSAAAAPASGAKRRGRKPAMANA